MLQIFRLINIQLQINPLEGGSEVVLYGLVCAVSL